MKSDTFFRETL